MPQLIYVDDDGCVISTTLAAILERSGYSAKSFTSPVRALQAAASISPDILLTEVGMTKMNGVDLALSVKDTHPKCRVV